MTELKPYPKYKDSGVEWIGEVPEDWEVLSFTRVLESIVDYRGKTPEKVSDGIFLVTARNIKNGIIDYNVSQEFIKPLHYEEVMRRGKPRIGDVLFTTEAPLGEVANVDKEHIALAQRVIKFRGKENIINNYYLKYWILSQGFQDNLQTFATGSTAQGIKSSKLGKLLVMLPSYYEQSFISKYLNKKTSEIDSLIANKEKLIELLEEKRQVVITETVTKGLDPNVKMKDSGIEWIGEIPEHWEARRLKYFLNIIKTIEPSENPTILSMTQNGIKVKDISTNDGQIAESYDKYQKVRINDFVMNQMDLLTGFVDYSNIEGVTSPDYRVFQLKDDTNYDKDYFLYYFQMCYYQKIFYGLGQGVSKYGRWRLQTQAFKDFFAPIPPRDEQLKIKSKIEKELKQINAIITEMKNVINILKQYRESLIYEAVTGKIDLRDFAEEEVSEERGVYHGH